MHEQTSKDFFSGVDFVIAEPLKFKAKLGIGEDAYALLRAKSKLGEVWDVLGAASTAGAAAHSTVVASAFFAPSWFLGSLGFSAVTPIGWVIGAAVLGGGVCYGVTRYLKGATKEWVVVIPNFINTPMDVLALGLFDLMAPLSLKVASLGGDIDASERKLISNYFVNEWGYDQSFIEKGTTLTEARLSEYSIDDMAQNLAKFVKENPDCSFDAMSNELGSLLREIIESDGKVNKQEEAALAEVQNIFAKVDQSKLSNVMSTVSEATKSTAKGVKSTAKTTMASVKGFFIR